MEWATCKDPKAMLAFLNKRGLPGVLWRFTVLSCQRVQDILPGRTFKDVLRFGDDMGRGLATWEMVDEALAAAHVKLEKLTTKYQEMDEGDEYDELGEKIDAAQVVFAFSYQCADEAARFISDYFLERAEDQAVEKQAQADLLRKIVPDPLTVTTEDEHEAEE